MNLDSEIMNYVKSNIVGIILVVFVIIGLMLLFYLKDVNLNTTLPPSKLVEVVTIESMDNINKVDMMNHPGESFCKEYVGDSMRLEEACSKLTGDNCKNSSCCGWLNGSKCVAGGPTGPTYKTINENGKQVHVSIDSYYYMNKCSGKGCPKVYKEKE